MSSSNPPSATHSAEPKAANASGVVARESDRAWRSQWSQSASSEFARAQEAGLGFSTLKIWHQSERGSLRNGGRLACLLAGSLALPPLAVILSPALLIKKTLPWFSLLCAGMDLIGPSSRYGVGIRVDPENLGTALLRVGPVSEGNAEIIKVLSEGGLSAAQSREAIVGHELGHLAYMGLMMDEKKRARVGDLSEALGVGRSLMEANLARRPKLPPLARQALSGAAGAALLVGVAVDSLAAGLAGMAAATYWANGRLKKALPSAPLLSAVIFEEGFCDAFSALLPLAGARPDRELALARAKGFGAMRSGLPFGASHGVAGASRTVIAHLESEGFGSAGLSLTQIVDIATLAASAPLGTAWAASHFDSLQDLMLERDALIAQASEHELSGSPASMDRRRRIAATLAAEMAEQKPLAESHRAGPKP